MTFSGQELSESLYLKFARLVYDTAGISLGDDKRELVRSRLGKRLRELELESYDAYYQYLMRKDTTGNELVLMIDQISTNKTDFFRENQHFQYLAEHVLPDLNDKARNGGSRTLRIWSAGCSSGEEPYTLAMVLREELDPKVSWDAKILATDISTRVLHFARQGKYEEKKVEPVPNHIRTKSFTRLKEPGAVIYQVDPEVKSMITFRRLNLMDASFPFKKLFQIIFCRNVMIYFDKATQEKLVNKYFQHLDPGGYLFIGHSETLNNLNTKYVFIKPTIYRKPK